MLEAMAELESQPLPRPVEPGELPREVEARVRTILRREARRLVNERLRAAQLAERADRLESSA